MDDRAREIQRDYVAELTAIKPEIDRWWEEVVKRHGQSAVHAIWPTGRTGHPRFLAIFRKYFLQIEEENDRRLLSMRDTDYEDKPPKWGVDDTEPVQDLIFHFDLLIYDIMTKQPDLKDLVDGLGLNPMGITSDGRVV